MDGNAAAAEPKVVGALALAPVSAEAMTQAATAAAPTKGTSVEEVEEEREEGGGRGGGGGRKERTMSAPSPSRRVGNIRDIFRQSIFCGMDRVRRPEFAEMDSFPIVSMRKAETLMQHSNDACGYYALYNAIQCARLGRAAAAGDSVAARDAGNAMQHRGLFIQWFCDVRRFLGKGVGDDSFRYAATGRLEEAEVDCAGGNGSGNPTTDKFANVRGYGDVGEILELVEAQHILMAHESTAAVREDVSIFISGLDMDVGALSAAQIRRLHRVAGDMNADRRRHHSFVFGSHGHWLALSLHRTAPVVAGGNVGTGLDFQYEMLVFDSLDLKTLNPNLDKVREPAQRDLLIGRAQSCRRAAQFLGRCLRHPVSEGGAAGAILDIQCRSLLNWLRANAFEPPLPALPDDEGQPAHSEDRPREGGEGEAGGVVVGGGANTPPADPADPPVGTITVREGDVLNLADGSVAEIRKATWGFPDDHSDITGLVRIFVTAAGGIHGMRATSEELGTRGNQGGGNAGGRVRRLHVEYTPLPSSCFREREAEAEASGAGGGRGGGGGSKAKSPQTTRWLESIGQSQNIRLFLQQVEDLSLIHI